MCVKSLQLCPALCHPVDHSPLGSSVLGIFQARILEHWCHALLQGILPTQGLNPGLLHRPGGFFTTSTTWEASLIRVAANYTQDTIRNFSLVITQILSLPYLNNNAKYLLIPCSSFRLKYKEEKGNWWQNYLHDHLHWLHYFWFKSQFIQIIITCVIIFLDRMISPGVCLWCFTIGRFVNKWQKFCLKI